MKYFLELPEEAEEEIWKTESGDQVLGDLKFDYLNMVMGRVNECNTDGEVMRIDMPEGWDQYIRKESDSEPMDPPRVGVL